VMDLLEDAFDIISDEVAEQGYTKHWFCDIICM
jgi:hypothetical protein